ncbi:outer membrane scaffolding protein for murein synthesis (MipA/OmpV family) [Paraburkholderia sp. RAU2J]|uniref:MipA/OmpV family protein n=1 Tax=Paraburkholderia sp. RAU2J TaxID=1938810 RepID=UPI000EB06BCE|nr:MipA/OmpV family protein [Paraburkholderia sp. RAU2J]RKT22007.1 outer membrane scaffolding protein for murein synthesis (MipA/OmpV family) [Paraburkholderia sp. RAU2J]
MLNSRRKRSDELRNKHISIAATSVVAVTLGGVAFLPGSASAQTPSPLGEWQYSAGIPLQKMYQPNIPDWQVRVGLATSFQPRFEGSARYHVVAGPSIDVRYKDLFFLSSGEGFGVNVAQGENWRVSLAAVYDLGRRERDDPQELNGLGNINFAPGLKLAGEYVVSKDFPLVLRADIRRYFGGSNGWIGDLGAYMPMPGSSKTFFWFAGPNVSFADSTYMNSWFGVNQQQAANSQFSQYHASAGVKSVGFGVSAVWLFNKHWFATADGAFQQLVGSAGNSPITRSRANGVADISINYRF